MVIIHLQEVMGDFGGVLGKGKGNRGHKGRPGQQGGSSPNPLAQKTLNAVDQMNQLHPKPTKAYDLQLSTINPGDTSTMHVEPKPDGLYYSFKSKSGQESKPVGPFQRNIEPDITDILKQVGGRATKFDGWMGKLVAHGDFASKDWKGNVVKADKWELGYYTDQGAEDFAQIFNDHLDAIKTTDEKGSK